MKNIFLLSFLVVLLSCNEEIGVITNSDDITLNSTSNPSDLKIGNMGAPVLRDNELSIKEKNLTLENCNSASLFFDIWTSWSDGPESEINFETFDSEYNFYRNENFDVHGHVLAWYLKEDQANWIKDFNGTPEEFERNYKFFINETVGRYPEVSSWDVLNEGIRDPLDFFTFRTVEEVLDPYTTLPLFIEGLANSIGIDEYRERDYKTRQFLGDNYLFKLFSWAKQANPNTDLYYNDYNLLLFPNKLEAVLELLDRARSEGAPIDGVGFQGHLIFPTLINYQKAYDAFKSVADRGFKVRISELDIPINAPLGICTSPPSFKSQRPEGEEFNVFVPSPKPKDDLIGSVLSPCEKNLEIMGGLQTDLYYDIARAYLDAVPKDLRGGITFFRFVDLTNWFGNGDFWLAKKIFQFYPSQDWPCIFDKNLEPKPGYYSFFKAIEEGG